MSSQVDNEKWNELMKIFIFIPSHATCDIPKFSMLMQPLYETPLPVEVGRD